MNKSEINQYLSDLSVNIVKEEFIYNFLSAFGLSKTTITRLRKGDYNLSKKEGELFYKGKIFFKVQDQGNLLNSIDELSKDDKILKQKPRFIVVTNFVDFFAIDTKLKINKEFKLAELADQTDFFLPLSGAEIYRISNNNELDRNAAYKLGELYDLLVVENPEWIAQSSHELNIFLSRLLFCFFAEDTGIFEQKNIFTETLINNTQTDGADIHIFLQQLFRKLNTKPNEGDFPKYFDKFPYVNGGLFRDDIQIPKFSPKARQLFIESGELDWAEINPDIFGSMIQAVADPSERDNLGMHYTSVINILKLIKPLFLDELYEEFENNKNNKIALEKLLNRLGKIKFFDPACGSGNFLIITYKELRNLEIQIINHLLDIETKQKKIYFSNIQLSQFYGIEIKDFAHEMAILSLWLAEHQMNQVFELELLEYGKSNPILPLKQSGNIMQGNAARLSWETACPKAEGDEIYIIGNPPYLGSRNQDAIQKKDMESVFLKDYKSLDYVAIWLYKGAKYIEGVNAQLAFVSTNSICQGLLVGLTWPRILNDNIEIGFAYQSFKWVNNAKNNAGVTVIIVGLRNKSNKPKYLFTELIAKQVKNINPYLIESSDIFILGRSASISKFPKMLFGNMPNDGGNLIFSDSEYEECIENDQSSKRYFKKFVGAHNFLNGGFRMGLVIKDYELNIARLNKEIDTRLKNVYEHRIKSTEVSTREKAQFPNQFYFFSHKETDSIIIPAVSSERREYIPIGFLDKNSIILNSAMAIYDAQPWLFGILHSKMHMVWVDAIGGKLETRYRYSAKLCYNTFPIRNLSQKDKETITQYVFTVLDERAKYPEKTMAWMYNPDTMPSGLKDAHKALDLAVERIYRLTPFNSDEERLEYLFKLYDEMVKKDTLFAKEKKSRKKK